MYDIFRYVHLLLEMNNLLHQRNNILTQLLLLPAVVIVLAHKDVDSAGVEFSPRSGCAKPTSVIVATPSSESSRIRGTNNSREGCCTQKWKKIKHFRGGGSNSNFVTRSRKYDGVDVATMSTLQHHGQLLDSDLPAGKVRTIKKWRTLPWLLVPAISCVLSYWSYTPFAKAFFNVVMWASSNTWIPKSEEELNLQTNIVTQVVNGPVITSVSVLFASLVSLTISNLHNRQVEIHGSLVEEVHIIRSLTMLLETDVAHLCLAGGIRSVKSLIDGHRKTLFSMKFSTSMERKDAHAYIESDLPALLAWCNHQRFFGSSDRRQNSDDRKNSLFWRTSASQNSIETTSNEIIQQIETDTHRLLHQRSRRWMALQTVLFPKVHYVTLTLLAVAIVISFLVATAQSETIFLYGLPVRVLWSVLITSFTALGTVCYDLSKPFGGAYHIL